MIAGLINVLGGVVMVGIARSGLWQSVWAYVIGLVLIMAGGFMIFEARKGWCVLRAMGIKTRV